MLNISEKFLRKALEQVKSTGDRTITFAYDNEFTHSDVSEILDDLKAEGYVTDINNVLNGVGFTVTHKALETFN